jgi:hypothetical protein
MGRPLLHALAVLLLDLDHGIDGRAVVREGHQHAIAQHLHDRAAIGLAARADPLGQLGDRLGGPVIAQCLEHGRATGEVNEGDREFGHGAGKPADH